MTRGEKGEGSNQKNQSNDNNDNKPLPRNYGDLLNSRVAGRVREIQSSGGLNYARIEIEVLYLLPKEFVEAYMDLFYKALKDSTSKTPAPPSDPDMTMTKGVKNESMGGKSGGGKTQGKLHVSGNSGGGGKKYKTFWTVKDEKALAKKKRVDTKLRALTRELKAEEKEEKELRKGGIRCSEIETHTVGHEPVSTGSNYGIKSGCGRFIKEDWAFCPECGKRMGAS